MSVEYTQSAFKHGFNESDARHAMQTALTTFEGKGRHGTVVHFIGHPHPQTDRLIEVIAGKTTRNTFQIFHIQEVFDR